LSTSYLSGKLTRRRIFTSNIMSFVIRWSLNMMCCLICRLRTAHIWHLRNTVLHSAYSPTAFRFDSVLIFKLKLCIIWQTLLWAI